MRRFLCWLGWHKWEDKAEKRGFTSLIINCKENTEKTEYSERWVPYEKCFYCGKRK